MNVETNVIGIPLLYHLLLLLPGKRNLNIEYSLFVMNSEGPDNLLKYKEEEEERRRSWFPPELKTDPPLLRKLYLQRTT